MALAAPAGVLGAPPGPPIPTFTSNDADPAIIGRNTGTGLGVKGISTGSSGDGVWGERTGSGDGSGVVGFRADDGAGYAVAGLRYGSGGGAAVRAERHDDGEGNGVRAIRDGVGTGNGLESERADEGDGDAVRAFKGGAGVGHALHVDKSGDGYGYAAHLFKSGPADGPGVQIDHEGTAFSEALLVTRTGGGDGASIVAKREGEGNGNALEAIKNGDGNGAAIYAAGNVGLVVEGRSKFITVGFRSIPDNADQLTVSGVFVSSDSHVSASLITNPGAAVAVSWIDRGDGEFTIHLTGQVVGETGLSFFIADTM